MKRYTLKILTILLFLVGTNTFAQTPSQTVKGRVVDSDTEIPVIGATIVLLSSNPMIGTTTDVDGYYKLDEVEIGRQSFRVTFIGYEDVYLKEILVESGRELVLNVSMIENINKLDDVVVTAYDDRSEAINQMTTISANQIT
ncbi:MAG: carboxypeptidase-like regulatory domain-containing protein, partial [Flavobacteriales bacterium]|nr:carboxypeptidase-like regulatory domain-containing protein [Flavobacteriales bacterium]